MENLPFILFHLGSNTTADNGVARGPCVDVEAEVVRQTPREEDHCKWNTQPTKEDADQRSQQRRMLQRFSPDEGGTGRGGGRLRNARSSSMLTLMAESIALKEGGINSKT